MGKRKSVTYASSGVSIDEGDLLVERLKKRHKAIGGFGGMLPLPRGYKDPQLVMATDGTGTKLLVAKELGVLNTIGIDLVAMVLNDIVVCGATPIAFLDYYATEKLSADDGMQIIHGIEEGLEQADCPLIGGETAEHPGVLPKGGFDLAGFGVGVVEKSRHIDGSNLRDGDVLLGLPSSGLHSNGYSLARKILLDGKRKPRGRIRRSILEEMLTPTCIYVRPILKLLRKVNVQAIAHITGGGIPGNLIRVLPPKLRAVVNTNSWETPELFARIQAQGPVEQDEMYRVFNMGIGMIVAVPEDEVDYAVKTLRRWMVHAIQIGHIEKGRRQVIMK